MDTALLAMIALTLGAGVCGGLLSAWNVHRRVASLERTLIDHERAIIKTMKSRAAEARWSKPTVEEQILAMQKGTPKQEKLDNEFSW